MGGIGGKKERLFKYLLLWCLCLYLIVPGQVLAADDSNNNPDEFTLEEIVVTGSRIARNNKDSASPIVTVDSKLFDQSATMAIETQLNSLPQFTPTAKVPTVGGQDIQPNATNTPGSATVALRGIGANRTLVLINGRRGTPANALGVVDINTIPTAAIEYVEAISGGASSTYGADAMAGVLNFIMREHFEGFQLDVQSGVTEEGDNFEYQVSGIMGANLAGDRGNVSVAFSYNKRNDAYQRDRSWYRDIWANPAIHGAQYFPPFSGFNTGYTNVPDAAVMNSVIDGGTFASTGTAGLDIFDDGNGNAFTGIGLFGAGGEPGTSGADIADGYRYVLENSGLYGINNVSTYLVLPLDRYNMFARGNYDINDYISVFGQGYFSKVQTLSHQEPAPIASGWAVDIDPSINRDVIPAELLAILDSRPDPNGTFKSAFLLPFDRAGRTTVYTYNIVSGLKGKIPTIDWTWEAFVSKGEAETTSLMTGFASLQRVRAIMTGGPNFGEGITIQGNQEQGGFGASKATCTSGLNPFDWSSVTQDCWDAIKADLKTKQTMKQTIWEANSQGHIADLPMGEMRGSVGYSYREDDYEFLNDTLLTQGTSFIEQALGLYPAGDSEGIIKAKEGYAELLVPVLSDLPFIKQLNLELGGRRSDYNTTGVSYTYKALGDWRTNDWLRIRGGYNRAERAPNIGELFLAPQQTFGYIFGGDVCSVANYQAWSANPNTNPDNWRQVVQMCGMLMEASGDPNADRVYYGTDYQNVAAADPANVYNSEDPSTSVVTTTQAPGFTTGFPSTVGNPDLEPEKADTWTFGFVVDSPFKDIPALSDWRVSIDYYNIKIKDAIGQQTADILMRQCVDVAFNPLVATDPAAAINSPYCAGFKRNQAGQIGDIQTTFFNNGRFQTSGIDFQVDWSMDLGPGRLSVSTLVNYLIEMKSAELDILPMVDYAGTFGPNQNGLNGSSYRWRALTTVGYKYKDIDLSVRWQHLDSIDSAGSANGDTSTTGAPSYELFDLLGNYTLLDNFWIRFGIQNVFNKEPPLTGVNVTPVNGMTNGAFNASNYDVIGRRFYLGARVFF